MFVYVRACTVENISGTRNNAGETFSLLLNITTEQETWTLQRVAL